jgi:hypothetical protein
LKTGIIACEAFVFLRRREMDKKTVRVLSSVLPLLCLLVWSGFGVANAAGNDVNRKADIAWKRRVITQKELERLSQKDPELSPSICLRLLAKLNARDFDYIAQDIREGKPIRVPNDFNALKKWTPLQKYIPDVADLPRFILIVRDMPFIGWYENGRLVGDSYICIGKVEGTTRDGLYTVKEKDLKHVSRSYPNAWGVPAPMPWALRIYETVWIHAGDIVGGYCSHGCINLPIFPAEKLFAWARPGTPVLIVDSLEAVPSVLAKNHSNCTLHTSVCSAVHRVAEGS